MAHLPGEANQKANSKNEEVIAASRRFRISDFLSLTFDPQ